VSDIEREGRYVALLRGINVGGRRRVEMAPLRELVEQLSMREVLTYLQSGNIVFTSEIRDRDELASMLSDAIAGRFGFEVPVVCRSAEELRRSAEENPFLLAGADSAACSVGFLSEVPSDDRVGELAQRLEPALTSSGHGFAIQGAEIYIHHPGGFGRSPVTNSVIDRVLKVTSTIRNATSVAALARLAADG
jgi:uncharacterized protein (DUF1697 family)